MPVDTSGSAMSIVPGVYNKPGVKTTMRLRGFLAALRLKTGQTLVVTSGIRTIDEQAGAMFSKVERLGSPGLDIYNKTLADEIRAGGLDSKAEIAATLTKQVARGTFMSRHMKADALDIRTRGLTAAERARILEVVTELGANRLDEGDHIHVEYDPSTLT